MKTGLIFALICIACVVPITSQSQAVDAPLFSNEPACVRHSAALLRMCGEAAGACSADQRTFCCSCEESLRTRFSYCESGGPFPIGNEFDPKAPNDLLPIPNVESGPIEPPAVNPDGSCKAGVDCFYDPLRPTACAEVNGFLGQKNVVSVVNQQLTALRVEVSYRDQLGIVQGVKSEDLPPLQRRDFIVNDLGLLPDTYGTACVRTDAKAVGAWFGVIKLRKRAAPQKKRTKKPELYDFALYYPFTNPLTGITNVPLSTEHRGVPKKSTVANWVRITDARPEDGLPLTGQLQFVDKQGSVLRSVPVAIPDGGRFDFPGHEGIGGFENRSALGIGRFIPEAFADGSARPYYLTTARYYYRCRGNCENFYTAFGVPLRRPTTLEAAGGVDTSVIASGKTRVNSLLELNNSSAGAVVVPLGLYNEKGKSVGRATVKLPANGSSAVTLQTLKAFRGKTGATSQPGAFTLVPSTVSTARIVSRQSATGELMMAYAIPPVSSNGEVQITQFDTTEKQKNEAVVHNTNDFPVAVTLNVLGHTGESLSFKTFTLPSRGTKRLALKLPADRFGTIVVQGSSGQNLVSGIVLHNLVTRGNEYGLVFTAQ
ncbi:MAG: hypothetical protein IT290_05085 [Deltaproteobacteria bacterium]|nr:hypothetical protein [Deltaproteobacteria bacterium]